MNNYGGLGRFYTRHRVVTLLAAICLLGLLWRLEAVDRHHHGRGHGRDRTPRPDVLGNKKGNPGQKSPNPPLEELKGGDPPNRSGISEPVGEEKKETAETTKSEGATATEWSQGPGCASYPKDASIVIVVKTGATEAFSKLPTILLTYLSCVPPSNLLLFSDLAGSIGPFAIHDSLDKVIVESTKKNPDFDLYKQQKALKEVGQTVAMLKSEGRDQAAWNLDKYKNIHTAQKSWDLASGRDWYLFIDADTYISWANLFSWLAQLDATKKLYLGSRVDAGSQPFAHGGSGYLLSKPAMQLLVGEDRKKVAAEYDLLAKTACCGDQELARALARQGLNVTNASPIINGEKVSRFGFGPGMWCAPVVTMHHMMSEEVQDLWAFESNRSKATAPLLLEELYSTMVAPSLVSSRDDWDNLSNDKQTPPENAPSTPQFLESLFANDPSKSFAACRAACEAKESCFQFSYYDQTCALEKSWRLGSPRYPWMEGEREIKYRSGWVVDRIQGWIKGNSPCMGPVWDADG